MNLPHNILKNRAQSTASSFAHVSNHPQLLNKTTGVVFAGVFISAGVITAALSLPQSGDGHLTASSSQSPESQASIKVNVDSSQSPAPTAATPVNESGSSNTSTSMSSTTNGDGSASTQVTVNGQPIAVPDNGTVQKTISSPNGNTSVTVTHGTSSNLNSSSTTLNVSSSTNSFSTGGQ